MNGDARVRSLTTVLLLSREGHDTGQSGNPVPGHRETGAISELPGGIASVEHRESLLPAEDPPPATLVLYDCNTTSLDRSPWNGGSGRLENDPQRLALAAAAGVSGSKGPQYPWDDFRTSPGF